MTMQNKITGKKIAYRPLNESDLSASERSRAYELQHKTARTISESRQQLHAASTEMSESRQKEARWFCLRVAGGHDFAVEKHLSDCGVEVLAPRERVVMVRRGKKIEGNRPYFPGYVLTRFVPTAEAFEGVRKQRHVVGFVSGYTGYLVVSDRDMKRFQHLTPSALSRMPTDKSIAEGMEARITYGPFAGIKCVVLAVKWKREGRVRVRITYDGKPFEISDMPLAFIEKL